MNLKLIAASAVSTAFTVADSLLVSVVYTQAGTVAYNADTGTVTPNATTQTLNALLTRFEADERTPAALREGERRAIIKRSDLTVTPGQSDKLTEGGRTWEVVGIAEDSTEAIWSVVMKRSQA